MRAMARLSLTVRDLRLGSGLVLFTYIALHLGNHALGLVSIGLAERVLAVLVAVWHSVPGTLLLYGAAATHVALALVALYRRRTLRMPALEVLRIALGLGIPILLIGHVVATRIAWEGYVLAPSYGRIVWSLWVSDGEGRQLAMLVPGWLHGCLGVNFAFGRRPWYRRVRLVLFAVALLLPVLGGLGFLAMAKALAADTAAHALLERNAEVDADTRAALGRLRDGLLLAWFALIAGVFIARAARAWLERRRGAVLTIAYPQRNARVPRGWTVLEASRSHHIPHVSACAGQARCSTRRVDVVRGEEHCPPPTAMEAATLARIRAPAGVRLACQLAPDGDIAVVPLVASDISPTAPSEGQATERELALVRITWVDRAAFADAHLPHDVVYMGQQLDATLFGVIRAMGGTPAALDRGAVTAIFMHRHGSEPNARAALRAIPEIERALAGFAAHHARVFLVPPVFTLVAHAGRGTVAGEGHARPVPVQVAGAAFAGLDAIEAFALASRARLVVSRTVVDNTGRDVSVEWLDAGGDAGVVAILPSSSALPA